MIVVALADIHGRLDHLGRVYPVISEADVVLIAGDITHFGGAGAVEQVISSISQYNPNILAVSGNCDFGGVDKYLIGRGIDLDCKVVALKGQNFAGIGGSMSRRMILSKKPDENRFRTTLTILEPQVKGKSFVFVSHYPAFGTAVDEISDYKHAGSVVIREFIERTSPLLAVSAHIHEAAGIAKIGDTTVVNPGPFRSGSYAYIEIDDKVETVQIRSY